MPLGGLLPYGDDQGGFQPRGIIGVLLRALGLVGGGPRRSPIATMIATPMRRAGPVQRTLSSLPASRPADRKSVV